MVRNHDDQSFLSWRTTLHPEAASVRLQNNNNPNPIVAVYQEISMDDDAGDVGYYDQEGGFIPVALNVMAVNDDNNNDDQLDHHDDDRQNRNDINTGSHRPQPWRHSNLMDLIIGGISALCAFTMTIKLEITAFILYAVAVGFFHLAEKVFGRHPALLLFRSIFLLLAGVMMFVDSVLLLVSVLVTEVFGAVALFLCTLTGSSRSGTEWHQFIRRTCHLTRWGFRSCLIKANWKPARNFPISESVESASLSGFSSPQDGGNHCGNEEQHGLQIPPPPQQAQRRQYSDDYCSRSDVNDDHEHNDDDDRTMSTLTTATVAEAEPVMISSEHVHIVDDDNDPFAKHSQRVTID